MHANSFAATAPVAWRIIAALVAVKLAVHAWADGVAAWGYMTDELCLSTPLDSLDRLGWGYCLGRAATSCAGCRRSGRSSSPIGEAAMASSHVASAA